MALSNGCACKKYYVFGNSDKISGTSNMSKITKNESNTSTQLIQQYYTLSMVDILLVIPFICMYVPFEWPKRCLQLYCHGQKVKFLICGTSKAEGILR